MGKKFYIATTDRSFTEEKTLDHAIGHLEDNLKEGEEGTIDCFQFYKGNEGEYFCVWHKRYKKNVMLEIVEEW